jgi:glycosyltransferase involved in cell wall biosynthesis
MNAAVLTVVSKNYLPFARTLMRSVERHNPSYRRFVVLTDTVDGCFDPASEPFTTILSSDLPIHQNRWLFFKYSILELNTAIKPYAMEYLAENYSVSRMIYLDADIKVYHSLDRLLDQLDSSDVLLTPHLLDPIDDGLVPAELDILRAGAYNLGFIAVRTTCNTLGFLRWWQSKLLDHCYVDFERGLFTDQRWMDLAPGMFSNVAIVRDPGYNVAYWNIKTRPVERAPDGAFTVAGGPLYFFHFSGLNVSSPNDLSKHQNRFQLPGLRVVQELVLEYVRDVMAHGYAQARQWPYTYGRFQNGVAIPDMLRRFVAECPDLMDRMQDPFSCEAYSEYVKYWNRFVPDPTGSPSSITRLAQVIYSKRPDLQVRAPEVFGRDLLWFLDWFVHNVQREYGVDETFIAPLAAHRNRLIREATAGAAEVPLPVTSTGRTFGPGSAVGLNIVGYLHAEMGVGEASRCAATAAMSAGLDVSLNNFAITLSRQQDIRPVAVDNQFLYDVNLFNVNADQTRVLFEHLEERHYAGKYNIGHWVWELEEFPDCWQDAFHYYDEIWVPTAFCQDSVARKSPIPVIRIPYAIEVEVQRPMSRFELGLPPDKFMFLSFLDVLSVPKRKNMEGVVAAFLKSGAARHGGHLVLKVNNGRLFPLVVEQLAKECSAADVTIINETWSRQKVNALIAGCDCLVSLHRSEGFGLPIAEAMYLGKPAIATAYSGNMDFTHNDTAMLVDYSLVAVGAGAEPYDPSSRWAEPDTDKAAEWMDRVQRDGGFRARIAQSGQSYIRKHFCPTAVGGMMKARVGRILGRDLEAKEAPLLPKKPPHHRPPSRPAPKRG